MAINKKDSRVITVQDHRYRYKVTGDIGGMHLVITSNECKGQIISAAFDYCWPITPSIVRQVIEYGLKNGWAPTEKGKPLDFGAMDERINIDLRT